MTVVIYEPRVATATESEPEASQWLRPERRDLSMRKALLHRVAGEFREVPGLCLTLTQGCRFFGLSEDVCERIFNALVNDGALQRADTYHGFLRARDYR
jgi:hypothetical protein